MERKVRYVVIETWDSKVTTLRECFSGLWARNRCDCKQAYTCSFRYKARVRLQTAIVMSHWLLHLANDRSDKALYIYHMHSLLVGRREVDSNWLHSCATASPFQISRAVLENWIRSLVRTVAQVSPMYSVRHSYHVTSFCCATELTEDSINELFSVLLVLFKREKKILITQVTLSPAWSKFVWSEKRDSTSRLFPVPKYMG